MAAKISAHIKKFKGDNSQNFSLWLPQFRAHCDAIGLANDKYNSTLLCCLEDTAFSEVAHYLAATPAATFEQVCGRLKTRFCGDDYKLTLQVKLQSMKFVPGVNVNTFIHELTSTVKCVYGIEDEETIKNIALNYITLHLEDSLRTEARLFQLNGNKSLETLLEFISTKFMCSSFRVNTSLQASASSFIPPTPSNIYENRLDKLEGMMAKVLTRLDDKEREPSHRRNKSVCQFCKKPGHTEERCFKKKNMQEM